MCACVVLSIADCARRSFGTGSNQHRLYAGMTNRYQSSFDRDIGYSCYTASLSKAVIPHSTSKYVPHHNEVTSRVPYTYIRGSFCDILWCDILCYCYTNGSHQFTMSCTSSCTVVYRMSMSIVVYLDD